MSRDFTKVKNLMWLLLIELEKEVKDINGNKICTHRTLWNIFHEKLAYIKYCSLLVCLLSVSYIG